PTFTPTASITPTNTLTPSITPTKTTTPTRTPTNTPTKTPNGVCPTEFSLDDPSPNPPTIPNAFYRRVTSTSAFTFSYSYLDVTSNTTGVYNYTTAPDGNNYPLYSANTGSASYLFTRAFTG
ncbi:MAG: hypothetical protein ACKO96_38335, partial [Flammeovirgaceae bacterium]